MSNLIPFDGGNVPSRFKGRAVADNSALTNHVGSGGFPVMSIKGKVFTLVKNQERTVITRPDDPDEAASAIEVIILAANPNLSKVYYAKGYEEGTAGAPDCYSNDGQKPASDSTAPQCKTCAACPQAIWGSGNQGKGKACSDSRRIAIATPDQVNEPMLLRIPAATLKNLAEFGKTLSNRGALFTDVVTKIRFDREEATPKLTFTPVGFLADAAVGEVETMAKSDLVKNILGLSDAPFQGDVAEAPKAAAPSSVKDDELEAAVAPAKAAIAKAAAPKAEKPAAEEAPAPKAEKPAAKAKAETSDDLDSLLSGLADD